MCSLCRQFPCHPRCPNAPEPVPLMRCKECGEGIYEGDEYYDTGNGGICKECIRHRKSRRRLMKEARYSLTQEQLNDLAAIAADRAVEAYRSEEQKTQKRKDNENVRITKKKLQSYRRVKASLAETEEFTEDEKIELRWAFVRDLMGSGLDVVEKADNRIRSVENKRKKDSFEIQSIDKAMALYKKEADNSSSEEAKRRYRELHAMYIDDEAHDVKEIAEMENISEKIVYRDIGIACKILAVYLLGM